MDSFKLKIAEELLYTGKPLPEDSQRSLLYYLLHNKQRYTRGFGGKWERVPYMVFKRLAGRKLRIGRLLFPLLTVSDKEATRFKTGMEKEHGCI